MRWVRVFISEEQAAGEFTLLILVCGGSQCFQQFFGVSNKVNLPLDSTKRTNFMKG